MSGVRYAAFLRNVNLGRPNSPTRVQLEEAFLASGAAGAESFQVNGTLVFTVAAGARARAVAARACEVMRVSCGMREPVFVRSVEELRDLVESDPFGEGRVPGLAACAADGASEGEVVSRKLQDQAPLRGVARLHGVAPLHGMARLRGVAPLAERDACCITFLGAARKPLPALPFVTKRGDLEMLRSEDTHVLSVSRWVGTSAGSPNAWLERTLGEPATTRNWRTVVRLVEKYSRSDGSFLRDGAPTRP